MAWQGFVSKRDWKKATTTNSRHWGILTLPEESFSYELHPHAKALKEDFEALKRKDISFDEWEERRRAVFSEISDSVAISIIATAIDRGEKCGAIVSEMMITSSRIGDNAKFQFSPIFFQLKSLDEFIKEKGELGRELL